MPLIQMGVSPAEEPVATRYSDAGAGIAAIALDMWEPYVPAVRAHVPEAATTIVFDRYHIMTHMGKAVDDVRKREHRALRAAGDDTPSGTKYLWLYAAENLPEQHREAVRPAQGHHPQDRPRLGIAPPGDVGALPQ